MNVITVQELKSKVDAGEQVNLLDVREQDEYWAANLGGKLLPLSQLRNMEADEIEGWKDQPVVVHCRSGARSMQACMLLEELGFAHMYNLAGGILEWQKQYGEQKVK